MSHIAPALPAMLNPAAARVIAAMRSMGAVLSPPDTPAGEERDIQRAIRTGVVLIGMFFLGFGAWAALAPLTTASLAPGALAVGGMRKTVQHLEGGIVTQILVREGSRVAQGQPLLLLETKERGAEQARLLDQLHAAAARHARFAAVRAGDRAIRVPDWLVAAGEADPAVAAILTGETRILIANRARFDNDQQIQRHRLAQAEATLRAAGAELAGLERQRALLLNEAATARRLLARGLERRPRLLELERAVAAMETQYADATGRRAQARESIAETRVTLRQAVAVQTADADEGLADTERTIADLRQQIVAANAGLRRSIIRAPASGTVLGLRVANPGAVIQPGEALMDIVPAGDDLIVEARVPPADIDAVHPGLEAEVHFQGLNDRLTAGWPARVTTISADSLTDSRTGQSYYLARLALLPHPEGAPDGLLHPGMPADVTIVTGSRTPLGYLLRPLQTSLRRAMRER